MCVAMCRDVVLCCVVLCCVVLLCVVVLCCVVLCCVVLCCAVLCCVGSWESEHVWGHDLGKKYDLGAALAITFLKLRLTSLWKHVWGHVGDHVLSLNTKKAQH
jgi:hypothetical protein